MKISYIFSLVGSLVLAVGSASADVKLSGSSDVSVNQTEVSNAPSQVPESDDGSSGMSDTQQVLNDALGDIFQLYTDWDQVPDVLDVGGNVVLLAIDLTKVDDLMETEAAAISARARGIRGGIGGGGHRRAQSSKERELGIRGIRGIREGDVCVTTGMITKCL